MITKVNLVFRDLSLYLGTFVFILKTMTDVSFVIII